MRLWRADASAIASRSASHRRVLSSTAVNTNVTVPEGTPIRPLCTPIPPPPERRFSRAKGPALDAAFADQAEALAFRWCYRRRLLARYHAGEPLEGPVIGLGCQWRFGVRRRRSRRWLRSPVPEPG